MSPYRAYYTPDWYCLVRVHWVPSRDAMALPDGHQVAMGRPRAFGRFRTILAGRDHRAITPIQVYTTWEPSKNGLYVRLPRTTGSPCPAGSTTMPLQAADGRLPQATPSRCPRRFGLLRSLVLIEPGHAGCALWRAGLLDVRQHAEEPSVGPLDHPEDWRVLLGQRPPTLCPIDHSRRRLRCRAGRRPGHDRRNHDPIRKSRRSCTRRSAGLTGRSNGGKKGLSASLGRERAFSPITTGPWPR